MYSNKYTGHRIKVSILYTSDCRSRTDRTRCPSSDKSPRRAAGDENAHALHRCVAPFHCEFLFRNLLSENRSDRYTIKYSAYVRAHSTQARYYYYYYDTRRKHAAAKQKRSRFHLRGEATNLCRAARRTAV